MNTRSIESWFFLPYANRNRFPVWNGLSRALLSFATKKREVLLRVQVSEYRIEFPVRSGTIISMIEVMINIPGGTLDPRMQDL
ncbi:MAG: hypothetical protein LUQ50_05790 [Methanospirillum sp.]|uniref:hypothetical protein n=1 Tax=Methanospirillum sp. TaxID=45200 RepID=UPI002370DE72|nr:hypothetical protein [Methanospirillum sp.]MDD1728564.1 hypothetical protein [Methanospirillum sp.]